MMLSSAGGWRAATSLTGAVASMGTSRGICHWGGDAVKEAVAIAAGEPDAAAVGAGGAASGTAGTDGAGRRPPTSAVTTRLTMGPDGGGERCASRSRLCGDPGTGTRAGRTTMLLSLNSGRPGSCVVGGWRSTLVPSSSVHAPVVLIARAAIQDNRNEPEPVDCTFSLSSRLSPTPWVAYPDGWVPDVVGCNAFVS